jgi:hypothetical protein
VIDLLKEIANDPGLSEAYAALIDLERLDPNNSIHTRGSPRFLEVRDEETEPKRRVNGEPVFDFDLDCDD